ncbi:hypothetical protein ACKLNO_01410 [Neisseriaceae bacterium B1]
MSPRQYLTDFIAQQYQVVPEFFWRNYPDYAVFRHAHNRKWFAMMMNVSGSLVGLDAADKVDVMNVKLPPEWMAQLSG